MLTLKLFVCMVVIFFVSPSIFEFISNDPRRILDMKDKR